jgi:hypothetical protein
VKAVIVMTKCFSVCTKLWSFILASLKENHEELCQNFILFEFRYFKARFRNVTYFIEGLYGKILFIIKHCHSPHTSMSSAKDIWR